MKNTENSRGLKCGLEIHQRLDTHKLFCSCYSDSNKQVLEREIHLTRKLLPSASELGKVDEAALFESGSEKTYDYLVGEKTSCLVETDDEPPHALNKDALTTALQIAKALHAKIASEIHTMRKIIVDGSTVSGFQRTALIGVNGKIKVDQTEVSILSISLEEESSKIIEQQARHSNYGLDRLGIPLVEIATGPDMHSPEQVKIVATELGDLLRNTGKVQRGLGTIRQDINVSIEGGDRVEIKGCQDLAAIEEIVRNEAQRQEALLELKRILNARKPVLEDKTIEITKLFQNTASKLISSGIAGGAKVIAAKLPGFNCLLKTELMPGFTFGKEVNDRAKRTGAKGILHSDEQLEKVGLTQEEVKTITEYMGLKEQEAFVMCVDNAQTATRAIQAVVARCRQATIGVPRETRRADGTITRFMRPLAGAARMYPETDILPAIVPLNELEVLPLVETPAEKVRRYIEKGLNVELAKRMAGHPKFKLFEEVTSTTRCPASTIAVTLLETLTALRREGVPVDSISDSRMKQILEHYGEGTIAKAAIPELVKIASTSNKPISQLINQNNLQKLEGEALRRTIVENQGDISKIMKKFKANVDPSQLTEMINELKKQGKLQ